MQALETETGDGLELGLSQQAKTVRAVEGQPLLQPVRHFPLPLGDVRPPEYDRPLAGGVRHHCLAGLRGTDLAIWERCQRRTDTPERGRISVGAALSVVTNSGNSLVAKANGPSPMATGVAC